MKKNGAPTAMHPRRLFLLSFLALAAFAHGQTDPSSLDGNLVHCGAEQVAIIAHTESKDGRFAAAWTIRPKGKQTPVDWSAYRRDDPLALVKKHGLNDNPGEDGDDPGQSGYLLVNGVLDLRAGTFTALAFESPYYPEKYRGGLEAIWSEDRHGARYGALANDVGSNHTDDTVDLRLVECGPDGVHVTDLKPAADRAVKSFLRRRDPKNYRRYSWRYDFEAIGHHSEATLTPFQGDALTVHFNADVFLEPNDQAAGYVSFALPKGTVTGAAAKEGKR